MKPGSLGGIAAHVALCRYERGREINGEAFQQPRCRLPSRKIAVQGVRFLFERQHGNSLFLTIHNPIFRNASSYIFLALNGQIATPALRIVADHSDHQIGGCQIDIPKPAKILNDARVIVNGSVALWR